EGEGYEVDETANSGTFTVTDGVTPATSPTVGVTATPTTLIESEQTVIEVTFTTEGDIPAEGLVVQLAGPPRAIAEFDVNATNPRLPEDETVVEGVTVTGGNIVGTDETAGSLFLRIQDPTATVTVPVFQDDVEEGTEILTFDLIDGEAYEVDPDASSIDVTIEDGGVIETPVVSISTTTPIVSEDENPILNITFTVDGPIPEGGVPITIAGDFTDIFAPGFLDGNVPPVINPEDGFIAVANRDPEFDINLTAPVFTIDLEIFDDIIEEEPVTLDLEILGREGTVIGESVATVTVVDGDRVFPGSGPTVSLSVTDTDLEEGDEFTVNFDVEGDIPAEGLQLFIAGGPTALGEFDIFGENGIDPATDLVGIDGFPLQGGDDGGFFVTLVENQASITLSVFDDGANEGLETLVFDLADGELYEVGTDAGTVTLTINDFETVGTEAGETLVGDSANNTIDGEAGDDTLAGGLGSDIILGDDGDDVLRGDLNSRSPQDGEPGGDDIIFGGEGNDRIGGKAGNDILSGDEGDDQIWGDDGDDILMGVTGNDILVGDNGSDGSGSDIFVFGNGDGTDTIVDFEVGIDFIGLVEGELTFADLTLIQDGNDTLLGVASSGETLAVLNDVQASALDESSFVVVPDVSNIDEALAL
ncbi:MAG: calcium-binding protein, partial [Cyanobacteria bacterium J06639_14]